MSKHVLVTGASGFTGSHLCRRLVEQGDRVSALVRRNSNLAPLNILDVEPIYCDLAHDDLPPATLRGIETVYHIAAVYRKEGVPARYFSEVNVGGTERLLNAALKSGVARFVHCSTVGVLGDIKNPPATEDAPYNPGDDYQRSKMEGERKALSYFSEHKLDVVVVRPAGIYGPGDTRFLKIFKSIQNGTFRMIGSGNVLYQMTYIEDLVDGFILAGEREAAIGEIFTIAGDEIVTIRELVNLVAEVLDRPLPKRSIPVEPVMLAAVLVQKICRPLGIEPPIYPRRLDFFTKDRAFDTSKAKEMLGFQPKVDLRTGLACTAEWYRANRLI